MSASTLEDQAITITSVQKVVFEYLGERGNTATLTQPVSGLELYELFCGWAFANKVPMDWTLQNNARSLYVSDWDLQADGEGKLTDDIEIEGMDQERFALYYPQGNASKGILVILLETDPRSVFKQLMSIGSPATTKCGLQYNSEQNELWIYDWTVIVNADLSHPFLGNGKIEASHFEMRDSSAIPNAVKKKLNDIEQQALLNRDPEEANTKNNNIADLAQTTQATNEPTIMSTVELQENQQEIAIIDNGEVTASATVVEQVDIAEVIENNKSVCDQYATPEQHRKADTAVQEKQFVPNQRSPRVEGQRKSEEDRTHRDQMEKKQKDKTSTIQQQEQAPVKKQEFQQGRHYGRNAPPPPVIGRARIDPNVLQAAADRLKAARLLASSLRDDAQRAREASRIEQVDGETHININHCAKTELGKNLCVTSKVPFTLPQYGSFNCLMGFWYYLLSQPSDERLRVLHGGACTDRRRTLNLVEFSGWRQIVADALWHQICTYPETRQALLDNTLPIRSQYFHPEKEIWKNTWESQWFLPALFEIVRTLKKIQSTGDTSLVPNFTVLS